MKILILFFLLIGISKAAVWETGKDENGKDLEWNNYWENRYEQWMKDRAKVMDNKQYKVFVEGTYAGLKTDCADAGFALRAIFARENSLPIMINSSVNAGRVFWKNTTNSFNNIQDPIKRFIAFVEAVGIDIGTYSVSKDTIPVEVSRDGIRAGRVSLSYGKHLSTIQDVLPSGLVEVLESTVPREQRVMTLHPERINWYKYNATTTGFMRGGVRAWKWPQDFDKSINQLQKNDNGRKYSNHQFELFMQNGSDGGNYDDAVEEILRLPGFKEKTVDKFNRIWLTLRDTAKRRVEWVNDSIELQKKLKGRKMSSQQIYNYSTPSRDEKIKKMFEEFISFYNEEYSKKYRLKYTVGEYMSRFKFAWYEDYTLCEGVNVNVNDWWSRHCNARAIDMLTLYEGLREGRISSDPEDSREKRWGFE